MERGIMAIVLAYRLAILGIFGYFVFCKGASGWWMALAFLTNPLIELKKRDSAMKYTSEPPTKPGWYWMRLGEKKSSSVVKVIPETFTELHVLFSSGRTESVDYVTRFYKAEWAGPIPEPEEGECD